MGMSFQGPPPPLPPIWREPAFWVALLVLCGAGGAFWVGTELVRIAALLAGAGASAGFSHYRLAARHTQENQLKAALWGKRGG